MTLKVFTGGMVATNGYLLQDGESTILVDAPAGIYDWLLQREIYPDQLLLTHQHFDHVEDAARFSCPIYAYAPFDREIVMDERARAWGMPVRVEEFTVAQVLRETTRLTLGQFSFELLHVPGHSPDSLVYSLPECECALVGDTVFRGGVGRSDLFGGDGQLLLKGIREKLLTLPPQTRLHPGHGPSTSPAEEKNDSRGY